LAESYELMYCKTVVVMLSVRSDLVVKEESHARLRASCLYLMTVVKTRFVTTVLRSSPYDSDAYVHTFGENIFIQSAYIDILLNSIWRPPPCWISMIS